MRFLTLKVISDIRNHLIPLLSARFYNTSTATTTTTTTITPSFHWAGLSGLTVSESGFRLFKSTFACTQAPTNNLNHPNTTTTTINKDFILVNKRTGQRRIIEYPISVLDDNDLLVESFRRIVSPCVCLALFKQQQQEEEKKGVYTTRPLLECSQPDVCYISNHEQQQQQQQQDFVGHDHLHECCWQVDSTIRLMINTNPSSLLL